MPQRPDVYRLFQQAQQLSLSELQQLVAQLVAEVESHNLCSKCLKDVEL